MISSRLTDNPEGFIIIDILARITCILTNTWLGFNIIRLLRPTKLKFDISN